MPGRGRVAAPPARVVLVEDDAALRRFVELSLEHVPIELHSCASVAQAWPLLEPGTWQLLVTDLMLPHESGLDLIERMAARPGSRSGRIVVFSAGVMPALRGRLELLGVWRVLSKPVSVATLEGCVREAVGLDRAAAPPRAGDDAADRTAISVGFGGDAALFHAYKRNCLALFPDDLRAGDLALAAGDVATLRRLAHNLKSVLVTLGREATGELARQLEDACASPTRAAERPALWQALRAAVERLAEEAAAR